MTNDILILAAGLGDVANAGLSDVSYSGYDILAKKFDPTDKKAFEDLPIFGPIKYVLRVVALFILLLFGYKIIAGLTSAKKLPEVLRSSGMYLVAAILLWDITIFISLLTVVINLAGKLATTITTLTDGVNT